MQENQSKKEGVDQTGSTSPSENQIPSTEKSSKQESEQPVEISSISKEKVDLKQLAKDIHHNKVFLNTYMRPEEDIGMVFMVLFFMNAEAMAALKAEKPVVLYEYYDKAGPRSINGYPCFFSARYLNQEEWDIVRGYVAAIRDAEKKALGEEPKKEDFAI